jgi:DMSO reductase family type II enzyme molybdopterin subunit
LEHFARLSRADGPRERSPGGRRTARVSRREGGLAMGTITRRGFLRGAGSAALGLSLASWAIACRENASEQASAGAPPHAAGATPAAFEPYGDWRDVYRRKWTWDRVVKGAHHVVNCVSSCPFNLYVKDGIVLREEQNTIMAALNPALPDFNPRGCQKGACFSDLMYSPQRIKYPLKRVGERGGGKWKRIPWDEAYDEIVGKMVRTAVEDGPGSIIYESGTANADYGAPTSGEIRFFDLLGATQLDGWAAAGDMPLGAIMTWGLFNFDSSSDDYFHSDLIYLWLGNPSYTRIPDAHFMWGARYNGAKIISVAPDYNASTMHVDEWVNLRVGTDAALALGMAHVIVEENLYKADFVKEQTDLPLLVRDDNRLFLRQADLESGGKDNIFYVWDQRSGRIAEAPGSEGLGRSSTLALGDVDPALDGSYEVELADGKTITVRPVFVLLRRRLEQFTPEAAGRIAGIPADRVRALGREFAKARAVSVFGSWGMMKHHHSDLFQRGIILLLAMTGNVGRRGAGIRIGAWYMLSSIEPMVSGLEPKWWQKALMKVFKPTVRELLGYLREYEGKMLTTPALLFLYEHGGLKDVVTRPGYHDAKPGKPLAEAIEEGQAGKWLPKCLPDGKTPKVLIHTRVNPLRRWPAPQVVEEHLWPKLDLIVGVNIKMSVTALKSDIILPAAGYYERRGIKYAQSYVPYYAVGEKAVDPLGESKTEWEIFGVMAQQVQERFKSQKLAPVVDGRGGKRDLGTIFDSWSQNGEFDPMDDLHFYERATKESPEMGYITWKEASGRGAIKIQDIGPFRTHTNICTDWDGKDSVYSCQWFVEKKEPWPTLTGRQQFYLDHPWFLEAGEELPTHKEPPKAGGDYPLRLTGGHTRWSIHSIWREEKLMLQLQRGEPVAYMSVEDAETRNIKDNDRIRMYNDVGACELLAKISPSVQPGQIIVYHAWEGFQFKNWRGNQEVVPSAWKSLHMAKYGQLHTSFLYGGPHHNPRGTTVDVARVA